MKLLFENWREYLKEDVVGAEFHFLQKIARDNGEILEYKEENGKHIVTLWELHPMIDPNKKYRGEALERFWIDATENIIGPDDEEKLRTLFQPTYQAEMETKEDAIERAKDMVGALQDTAGKENEADQHYDEDDDKVVSLFENWRKFLTESQLLIEGRIQDAQRKFPELVEKREELDGENLLDILIQADPSENQKYLMGAAKIVQNTIDGHLKRGKEPFWGKLWPEDDEIDPEKIDKLFSPWGITKNTARELETFHMLQKYVEPEQRDINRIKDYGELSSTISTAVTKKASAESEKDKKQQEKTKAKEGSRVIVDTEDYTIIRPETTEASCFYGKGTKWCISATEYSNAFDEYSAEGKTFYFVFLGNLSNDNKYKKIAFEMEPSGEFNRAWNAWDEPMDFEETTQGIIQNLLNQKVTQGAPLWYQHITGGHMVNREDVSKEDAMEYAAAMREMGIDYDADIEYGPPDFEVSAAERAIAYTAIDTQREESVEALEIRAMDTLRSIIDIAQEDAQQNPSIGKEPYLEMMGRYQNEVEHLEFELKFPDETGESHIELNSYIWINIPIILANHHAGKTMEWTVPWEEPETLKQIEEIIRDTFRSSQGKTATYASGVPIYDLESVPDDVRGGGPYFKGVVDYSHVEELDDLRVFLNEMLRIDDNFSTKGYPAILKALMDAGLVAQEGHEAKYWQDPEEIEKQGELDLQESYKRWAQLIK